MDLHSRDQNDITCEIFGWFYGCNISHPKICNLEK